MRYPDFIKPGDTIGFPAPSFGCNSEPYYSCFRRAEEILKALGYGLEEGPNCFAGDGIGKSSTPEKCGAEFNEMYMSGSNAALISCGGGETMCEDLNFLDFDRIRAAKPKWFMGFSDNTNFTYTLATICDVASVYGPCASSFGMRPWHRSITEAFAFLEGKNRKEWLTEHGRQVEAGKLPVQKRRGGSPAALNPADETGKTLITGSYGSWQLESLRDEENPYAPYRLHKRTNIIGIRPDGSRGSVQVKGRLIGGCMDILINLLGTKFDHTADFVSRYAQDGILWYLEACDLTVMSMRRAIWQMTNAGWFEHASGFVIGRPLHYDEEMMGLDRILAVSEPLLKLGVPLIMDADIGHLPPMMPLINGSLAEMTADGKRLFVSMELK